MLDFEREVIDHYYAGEDRTYICVYPVVVIGSEAYNINVKTALYINGSWRLNQIFSEENSKGFMSWEDVLQFTKAELTRLYLIMRPLFNGDKLASWIKFCEINDIAPPDGGSINNDIDQLIASLTDNKYRFQVLDFDLAEDAAHFPIQDYNNTPRTTIEHWMPIWVAWQSFSARLLFDYNSGLLKTIN